MSGKQHACNRLLASYQADLDVMPSLHTGQCIELVLGCKLSRLLQTKAWVIGVASVGTVKHRGAALVVSADMSTRRRGHEAARHLVSVVIAIRGLFPSLRRGQPLALLFRHESERSPLTRRRFREPRRGTGDVAKYRGGLRWVAHEVSQAQEPAAWSSRASSSRSSFRACGAHASVAMTTRGSLSPRAPAPSPRCARLLRPLPHRRCGPNLQEKKLAKCGSEEVFYEIGM